MARLAREKSETGIYHIMLRGLDKRNIFLDDEDRLKFIDSMIKAMGKGNFELYGYCLMGNHVHLLLKAVEEPGTVLKRITVGYVGWNNRKYERTGHLFQNRYLSEPVESESYLLTVLRYIHQNPLKAGMVKNIEDYRWSSYQQYEKFYKGQSPFISGELIKAYFKTLDHFRTFMCAANEDQCLEENRVVKYNDKRLRELIINKYAIRDIKSIPKKEQDAMIKEIYSNIETSIRQLSRVLGIGKTAIERVVKQDR